MIFAPIVELNYGMIKNLGKSIAPIFLVDFLSNNNQYCEALKLKTDLNELEEIKWEFCIKAIDYYLYNAVPMRSDAKKYLSELKEDLQTFLKEQE